MEAKLAASPSQSTTSASLASTSSPSTTSTLHPNNSSTTLFPPTFSPVSKPQWRGIYVDTAHLGRRSYYGPSSSFYFVSRIGSYLGNVLQQPLASELMQLRGPSKRVHRDEEETTDPNEYPPTIKESCGFLSRPQEEALFRLFWEGYHCLVPIVDEVDFRRHYASLWEPTRKCRRPSPLVDIILALCLQYGYAYIPPAVTGSTDSTAGTCLDDATSAGRWYYRRSQYLILADLESPSIATVQSYIFAISYLCCASFQNMSHILAAQAIRTAQVLGLHTEPAIDLPYGERELRKRIWWTLWIMDTKISSKLGRPFLVDGSQVTATMYSDSIEAASYNGATLGSHNGVTWLTYALQNNQMYLAFVDVFHVLWENFGIIIHRKGLSCVYTDADAVEECAKIIAPKMSVMKAWAENVPSELKMRRRSGASPYCTNCLAVEINTLAPTWLQRQSVCLELSYHNALVNLTRPFITFYSHPGTYSPAAEHLATTCVDHAVSFMLIMHQIVTESDLMNNWSEYFSMQWNTAITLVGFVLAYPIHQATLKARRALDKAIIVFDFYGASFAVSADAAAITRDLAAKADMLAGRATNSSIGTPTTTSASGSVAPAPLIWGTSVNPVTAMAEDLAWLDPSQQDGFSQFMDWALSVDASSSFERFFNPANVSAL
ncbi:hypothetical protein SEUCBS139899_005552 [Sporothrix eucalyptigena]|uniref:Xylanolytic transcriptional activator regulatory domain-containing protein n=1 Tax=Sporothrix eucalyptigena TaxID=1812306 RepID=A0ABP0C2V3_9PEZI